MILRPAFRPLSPLAWRARLNATSCDDELLHVLTDICGELEAAGLKEMQGVRLNHRDDIERLAARLKDSVVLRCDADWYRMKCAFDILSFAFVALTYRRCTEP